MAYSINLTIKSTNLALIPLLEIIAENAQRNKQKILCKHSIHQPKIARLIKDQIFTSIECAEIDSEESPRARFTLAKDEPLRSFV